MTEKYRSPNTFDLQLPDPSARVLALRLAANDTIQHLALPDVREETLCRRAVPADIETSKELLGSTCTACRSMSDWLGLACGSCGLPLLAEYDPGLCFVCSCRQREQGSPKTTD